MPWEGGYESIVIIGNDNIKKNKFIKEINNIFEEFNINNKSKGIDINANLLNVNIAKKSGTILY